VSSGYEDALAFPAGFQKTSEIKSVGSYFLEGFLGVLRFSRVGVFLGRRRAGKGGDQSARVFVLR